MVDNLKSYSTEDIVNYYKKLSKEGLFYYEKNIVKRCFLKNGKVLDIGCGVGRTSVALKNMGYDVVGIDYSEKMIEAARSVNENIKYFVQDVKNMDFPNEVFDCAIFSFNGLMLLFPYSTRKQALLEIRRILKVNGVLFFTTPFLDNKINSNYWREKIKLFGGEIEQLSQEELIRIGDEIIEEEDTMFKIHVPFLFEIENMIYECGFKLMFNGRRLDLYPEEKLEDELDDNYIWVVKKANV